MKKFIAYCRVSTTKQGESGLGIEAQQAAVRGYVNGHGELVAEYLEVETGKRADRPQLLKAIAHARRERATLVLARLDRLARNVRFVATLMESGVDFVASDNPTANKLTVHVLAAVAEAEARAISERTVAALAAYKARGGKLGAARPECREIAREAGLRGSPIGAKRVAEQARAAYLDLLPSMTHLRNAGKSLREIARHLNDSGHATRNGQMWSAAQVKRILDRSRAAD
jgi:DNA invertase Pin-like site-specific DNA recombinase